MATKRTEPQRPKTILIKPRMVFEKELKDRVEKGKDLQRRDINNTDELTLLRKDIANWNDFNKQLIKSAFNNEYSEFYYEYDKVNSFLGLADYSRGTNTDHPAYKLKSTKERVENCMTILNRLIEKLPLIEEVSSIQGYQTKEKSYFNRGFIVHGHNEARKFEIARFVENDLKKKAIILHEQPNKGRTIIEKFEDYALVDFAVAIWTADDVGRVKTADADNLRARQNVVFETGFFIGKIGRTNVIVLHEEDVEIPSDYSGVIFIKLDGNWKDDLRKEIEAVYE
jgi:predicted nucleotide-binding protein